MNHHDACYLGAAVELGRVLVTADQKLIAATRRAIFGDPMVPLSEDAA